MLTDFGLIFIPMALSILLFSIWIGRKWIHALVNKNKEAHQVEKIGCIGSLFTTSVFFTIFSIAVSMSIFLPALIYKTFLTPRFAATVTHHTTSWQESDRTDASGQTIRTKTLMYTPYVSFQDTHGLVIKNIPLSIRSSAPLQIGESITIGYSKKDHIAYETSFRSSLLYAAGALLLLIQWFLSIWIIAYSFQRQTDKFIIFAQFLIFRVIIPMATTAMLCMLFYVLFEYYFLGDPKKQPIWVVLMCIIFSLSIIPVLFYLIKPKDNTNG